MLELKEVTKIYRTETVETTALNKLCLQIETESFYAIKGPSGCGKSTLLNLIGLMDKPSSGSILFNGRDCGAMTEKERNKLRRSEIGFVFQKFNLIDSLTVFENVELPLLYNRIKESARKEKVNALLERLNLTPRAKHYPYQLSGGQQQRVSLARCIVTDPHLILADEPTGNLDSAHGQEVMKLLQEMQNEGRTIVMVTHDDNYASYAQKLSIYTMGC